MSRGFRSTQILRFPSDFGTTTMPAHQGVGSSTFLITPIDSMQSSSALTSSLRGRGTFLSSPKFPSPVNKEGNASCSHLWSLLTGFLSRQHRSLAVVP